MMGVVAPGARVVIRDAEWLVRKVDTTSTGGRSIHAVGLSELVKDREAIFLSELEREITILVPAATKLVPDTSPRFRDALLYIESLMRQTPPTDPPSEEKIYIGHKAAMDLVGYQLDPALQALQQPRPRILIADAYLKARQLETGERPGHNEYGKEFQKVKAFIAANNVYGVDLNPAAVELAEVSLWLNITHPGCPVPWFNMQLVAGNSLIGARRQAFSSHLLRPKRGEKSWLDEVPVRYPLKPAEEEPTERPTHSVYHSLLPDTGMANYNDKVVKQMSSKQLDLMKKWRTQFCKSLEKYRIAILERLSVKIDQLWQQHIEDRRRLREETRDAWGLFRLLSRGCNEGAHHAGEGQAV